MLFLLGNVSFAFVANGRGRWKGMCNKSDVRVQMKMLTHVFGIHFACLLFQAMFHDPSQPLTCREHGEACGRPTHGKGSA